MAAARRLKGELPITDPRQAVEVIWKERARVKMSVRGHWEVARRIRPEVSPLSDREAVNVGLLKTYVPWAKALGLQLVFIDGDIEVTMATTEDLTTFIEGVLKRRGMPMMTHIRACMATGKPGGRAIKEIKMGRAEDIWLSSVMVHKELLGFAIVLRTA